MRIRRAIARIGPYSGFHRIYGAYEGEVLAREGKLRVMLYICSGTALNHGIPARYR